MKRVFYCPKCGDETERNDQYDAYFCKACDMWTESKCSDGPRDCSCCHGRPEKPSQVMQRVIP